jgi:hypothetical protein
LSRISLHYGNGAVTIDAMTSDAEMPVGEKGGDASPRG